MNVRRFLWVALIVSLGMMLVMGYLQRRVTQPPPAEPEPPAGQQAATRPAGKESAVTRPAPTLTAIAAKPPAEAPAKAPAKVPAKPPAKAPAAATAPAYEREWDNTLIEPEDLEAHERVLGSLDQDSGYKLQVQLTGLGAAVRKLELSDYFMTVADKRRYDHNWNAYQEALEKDPELQAHYSLLNPVGVGAGKTYPLATRRIRFPEHGDVGLGLSGPRWAAGPVETDENGVQSVTFTSTIFRHDKPFVRVKKTYSLAKDSYSLEVVLGVENLTGKKLSAALTQFGPTGVIREDYRQDKRTLVFGKYVKGDLKVLKEAIGKLAKVKTGLGAKLTLGRSDAAQPVLWVGQSNKYFASLAYVVPAEEGTLAAPGAKVEFFRAALATESPDGRTHLTGMNLGSYDVEPGKHAQVRWDVFAGPKKRDLFDGTPLYHKLHYKQALDFESCCTWCAFPWLSLAMMSLLDVFSRVALGNYGLAIIMLVILVRIVLHPLTKKSQVSMAGMQKLQPEIAKIREKYKDDKAKLNEETMKLYKTQGAKPMLGCLPMLLQFPIWIALWTGLQAAVELRHAAFLPVWITDLAAPMH